MALTTQKWRVYLLLSRYFIYRVLRLLSMIITCLISFGCAAQHLINLAIDSTVVYGKLHNGFSYAVKGTASGEEKIRMWLFVDVGYRREALSERGISHFIEHLGFRGTKNFPASVNSALTKVGLSLGGDFSASTGDITTYKIQVPRKDHLAFETSLLALRDIADGQLFNPQEVDEERSAVLNEMGFGSGSAGKISDEIRFNLLSDTNRFPRTNDGEQVTVNSFTPQYLKTFYNRWYKAENMTLVIVGDVNQLEVENQIKKHFNGLPSRLPDSNPEPSTSTSEDSIQFRNHQVVIIAAPESSRVSATVYRIRPSKNNIKYPKTIAELKKKVIDDLFVCLLQNRCAVINSESLLTYSDISISLQRNVIAPAARLDGLLTTFRLVDPGELKKSLMEVGAELNGIARWGFTDSEIARAKRKVGYAQSQVHNGASYYVSAIYECLASNSKLPVNDNALYLQELNRITADDILLQYGAWLTDNENASIVITCPPGLIDRIPSSDTVLNWLYRAEKSAPKHRIDEPPVELNQLVPEQRVLKFKKISTRDTTITKLKLENGALVVMKLLPYVKNANQTEDKSLALHVFRTGGASNYIGQDYKMALAAAPVQNIAGLSNLSRKEYARWQQLMNEVGYLSASPYITKTESGIRGGATSNNYESLFNLVYLHFSQPRPDPSALDNWIKARRTENSKVRSAYQLFEDTIAVTLGGPENEFKEKDLDQLRYERTFELYKDLFSNPAEYTFVIVGHFAPKELIELANRYFGSISKRTILQRKASQNKKPPSGTGSRRRNVRIAIVGDSIGNVTTRLMIPCLGKGDDGRNVKLKILAEVIKTSLFNRLREREKGVYAVFCSLNTRYESSDVMMDISFEAPMNRIDKLIASTIDEMQRIQHNKLESDIFNNAQAVVKAQLVQEAGSPYYWLAQLHAMYSRQSFPDYESEIRILNKLKPADLSKFARTALLLEGYALFKLI